MSDRDVYYLYIVGGHQVLNCISACEVKRLLYERI